MALRGKVKYYFRKPKGEIVKDILLWAATGSAIAVAATSPYFVQQFFSVWNKRKRYRRRSVGTAFQRLKKKGLLVVERRGYEYHVSLTSEGRKRAGWLQIDALKISKPHKWDKRWRFLMFDVKQMERWKRDVLRSFLRRLGFLQFQKSVWIHPYACNAEVDLLKEFVGLTGRDVKLIVAENIGEDLQPLKDEFGLR